MIHIPPDGDDVIHDARSSLFGKRLLLPFTFGKRLLLPFLLEAALSFLAFVAVVAVPDRYMPPPGVFGPPSAPFFILLALELLSSLWWLGSLPS